jgi:hypothetical protein
MTISLPTLPPILSRVRHLVITVIHCGETLLLYHKRLAKSEASYGFLHQIDLLEHWDRYASTGRIASEIHQLVTDLRDLLQGYEAFLRAEDKFIIGDSIYLRPLNQIFFLLEIFSPSDLTMGWAPHCGTRA